MTTYEVNQCFEDELIMYLSQHRDPTKETADITKETFAQSACYLKDYP